MLLMVYRLFKKKYLNEKYTCDKVFNTLHDLNITHLNGTNYITSLTRMEVVDARPKHSASSHHGRSLHRNI